MISLFRKRKPETPSNEPVDENAKTILIVDDSPTEIHVLKKILNGKGFNIEVACNGKEGVEMGRKLLPDLILMDVVMPELNGFQATRQLNKNAETANIPVIMVTTKDQDADKSWAQRQGAIDYVVKPVAANELLLKIRNALSG